MTIRSTIQLKTSSPSDRVVLCAELSSPAHLLLWGVRRLIADRLDDRQAALAFEALLGRHTRATLILLRTWLAEIALHSRQRIRVGTPCCRHVHDDELRLLAALVRAQAGDIARGQMLLQTLLGTDRVETVAAIADRLGDALLNAGCCLEPAGLLPPDALPGLH